MFKLHKDYWTLDIGQRYGIQLNWAYGFDIGISYKNDGYSKCLAFNFIKPTITFIYYLPTARGL